MGLLLSPVLADIFMAKLKNGPLYLYKNYIDENFLIYEETCSVDELLRRFNDCHPSIKFTVDEELNSTFHFLGVMLKRSDDGSIQRSVYRKPTWTGQFTNFNSWVPLSYVPESINLFRRHGKC
ncbi:unnamed protein product [Heterobilharzia americana]|nr:unnamed protein product [Heterobilharzia americana]